MGPNPTGEIRAHSPAQSFNAAKPLCYMAMARMTIVLVENTIEMRAALKAAGVPVETYLFCRRPTWARLSRAGGRVRATLEGEVRGLGEDQRLG